MHTDDETPFSYPVKVAHISANAVEVKLSANDRERAGLADLWSVLEVKALDATFTVQRWKRDGVRLKGRVTADIVQACVVTLDPVEAHIDEPVEVIFVPEGSKLARLPVATETGARSAPWVLTLASSLCRRSIAGACCSRQPARSSPRDNRPWVIWLAIE